MNCERELIFAQKLLDHFFIPLVFLHRGMEKIFSAPSVELRRLLQPAADIGQIFESLVPVCQPRVIYRRRDELDCTQLYFLVQGGDDPVIATVGPYLSCPVTPELLRDNAAKFPDPDRILPSLEKYYRDPLLHRYNAPTHVRFHTFGLSVSVLLSSSRLSDSDTTNLHFRCTPDILHFHFHL